MKSTSSLLFVIVFCALIFVPGILQLCGVQWFEVRNENRTMAPFTAPQLKKLDPFPDQFNAYFNDHFSFRTPLLDGYHLIKHHVFHVSPNRQELILGKDGWCFAAGNEKRIYEGELNYTENQLNELCSLWKDRKVYFDSLDISVYWMIDPLPHFVYEEQLPWNIRRRDVPNRIEELRERLEPILPGRVLYPLEQLKSAKDTMQVYYKLDNHWNYEGAFVATHTLVESMKHEFPDLRAPQHNDYYWMDMIIFNGIHGKRLGLKGLQEHTNYPINLNSTAVSAPRYGFKPPEGFAYWWDYENRWVNPQSHSPIKVLVIRDSFAHMMIPFLKESFGETVLIFDAWQFGLNADIVETMKPDAVVYLTSEPLVDNLLTP